MAYQDSEYVKKMQQAQIRAFDHERELNDFRKQFKKQIENGLTEEKLKKNYRCDENSLKMFREIVKEVEQERQNGAAFLIGFNNPDFRNMGKK